MNDDDLSHLRSILERLRGNDPDYEWLLAFVQKMEERLSKQRINFQKSVARSRIEREERRREKNLKWAHDLIEENLKREGEP